MLSLTLAAVMLVVAYFRVDTLGPDGINHAQWIRMFPSQVLAGDLRPTWLFEAFEGLGAPTFYFYPPFPYWIATPFYPLISILSDSRAYMMMCFIGSCIAFFGCRSYLRMLGISGGLLVACSLLYAVAPFRIYELFSRSGMSAHYAVGFIPLIFLGIDGLVSGHDRAKYFVVLAISYACLVLSNIPVFVMTSVIVVIYLIVLSLRRANSLWHIVMSIALAAVLCAFYLLPIPSMMPYVQSGKLQVISGMPVDGIRSMINLLHLYDITESVHSTLNLLTAMVMVVLLVISVRRQRSNQSRHLVFVLVCTGLVLLMQMVLISGPIWSIDAVRTLIQFPHRWSAILIFALTLAYATLNEHSMRQWLLIVVTVWGAASAGFSTLAAFDLRVHSRGEIPAPLEPPEYATIYSPKDKYEVVAIAREHKRDPQIAPLRQLAAGEFCRETLHDAGILRYEVGAQVPLPVIFQQWRWPYWKLVNSGGAEIQVSSDSTGRALATLPAGVGVYELCLVESREEKAGMWISLCAIAFVAGYSAYLAKQDRKRTTSVGASAPLTS